MVHTMHPTSANEHANTLAANSAAKSPVGQLIIAGSENMLAAINEQPASSVTPNGMTLPNGHSLLVDRAVGTLPHSH